MKKICVVSAVGMSVIIVYFGICFLFLWRSLHPEKIFFNRAPYEFGLNAEHTHLFTDDGLKLSGWLIASKKNKQCAIILVHGYPSEKSELLPLATTLAQEFSVFLFDQRYFGTSEGSHTTLGIKEQNDLMRAIDLLNQKGYSCIGVFGHSFGGAVGMLAAAKDSRIRAIVSYGAFSNISSAGIERYKTFGIARYALIDTMMFMARLWIGDLEKNSPINAAKKIRAPFLLAHSIDDEKIPFKHAQYLQKAFGENKIAEYYFPRKTRHAEFSEVLQKKTRQFFIKHLVHP